MIYPRCLSRLRACEVVNTFDSFTGRDSRKPSGVYGFKSVSMCQIAPNPATGKDGNGLPVSLELLYTDELLGISQWPDTSCSYQVLPVENGKIKFRFWLNFSDMSTKKRLMTSGSVENRPNADRCALIYYQLHQPDTSLSLHFTLSENEEIGLSEELLELLRNYSVELYQYACGGNMPKEVCYDIELPMIAATKQPRLVNARMTISRNEERVQKYVPLLMGSKATSEIPPYSDFEMFCQDLENAFYAEKFCMKLAKGAEGLYAFFFGENGCQLEIGIAETPRGLFAQKPASLKLLNREKILVTHLDGTMEERSFYGVDMDLWMSGFLSDFENLLSPGRMETLVTEMENLTILGAMFTHVEVEGMGWFSFVHPFRFPKSYGQVQMEKDAGGNPVSVPVILREYPELPVLVEHRGTMGEDTNLTVFLWSYQTKMKLKLAAHSLEEFPQLQVDYKDAAEYELLFEELPLEKIQSMSVEISSTRNEAFFLPGYGERNVRPEFVYHTRKTGFPQMVSPFGSYGQRIMVGRFLAENFCSVFQKISQTYQLQFTVFLEQILYGEVKPPVTADFPICFSLKRVMGQNELWTLWEEVNRWVNELPERSDSEQIKVSVQCYSRELEEERMLLEWKNLIFSLE